MYFDVMASGVSITSRVCCDRGSGMIVLSGVMRLRHQ
jgi:hypothetical protein